MFTTTGKRGFLMAIHRISMVTIALFAVTTITSCGIKRIKSDQEVYLERREQCPALAREKYNKMIQEVKSICDPKGRYKNLLDNDRYLIALQKECLDGGWMDIEINGWLKSAGVRGNGLNIPANSPECKTLIDNPNHWFYRQND